MSLTAQQKTDHIKDGAQKCPFCGTDDGLNYDNVVVDAGTCYQQAECYNCNKKWE